MTQHRNTMYAKRFAGHEAYCFHSTAVIDHGCLRYGLLMRALLIVCISEALLKLEQPKNAKWATSTTLDAPIHKGAPWRLKLKRWKPIRISPNLRTKRSKKGMNKMMMGSHVVMWDRGTCSWERGIPYL